MQGYNFTDHVRHALAMAREEAARLHHEYVGTEHLLLGLIRLGDGVAAAVLDNLGVDDGEVKARLEEVVKEGIATRATGPDLPYTNRAKKVLELAMSEARELNHSYVGTEHLLLGLLREEKGIAAQVLMSVGLTLDGVREATLRLLGTHITRGRSGAAPGELGGELRMRVRPSYVRVEDPRSRDPALERDLLRAELRRTRAEGAKVALEAAWTQVRGLLDVAERTGTPTRLERVDGDALWLVLGDDLMRVRIPGEQPAPPAKEGV